MKVALFVLTMSLTIEALASKNELSYKDHIEVKKTVMRKDILLKSLINLHQDFPWESKRMIAGNFEKKEEKSGKKSYLEGLRSKLNGCTGYTRF